MKSESLAVMNEPNTMLRLSIRPETLIYVTAPPPFTD